MKMLKWPTGKWCTAEAECRAPCIHASRGPWCCDTSQAPYAVNRQHFTPDSTSTVIADRQHQLKINQSQTERPQSQQDHKPVPWNGRVK